jgi:hypothetical protein
VTLKHIYLVGRGPGIAAEDFPAQWKAHSALAGQFPQLSEQFIDVVYLHRLEDDASGYDGVAVLEIPDLAAAVAVVDDPDHARVMEPDENRVFGVTIADVSIFAEPDVLVAGPANGAERGSAALIMFATAAPNVDTDQFLTDWRDRVAAAVTTGLPTSGSTGAGPTDAAAGAGPGRWATFNRVIEAPFPTEPDVSGIVEIWFDSDEGLREFLRAHGEQIAPGDQASESVVFGGRRLIHWRNPNPPA